MEVVADTNVFLAVALGEPERAWLIDATEATDLVAPTLLPYEIGNALSALVRRNALNARQALATWRLAGAVAVELVEIDVLAAVELAAQFNIYAYDAYFLQCALTRRCPLLTLDQAMTRIAEQLRIEIVRPS